jgi:hypothetical protein
MRKWGRKPGATREEKTKRKGAQMNAKTANRAKARFFICVLRVHLRTEFAFSSPSVAPFTADQLVRE